MSYPSWNERQMHQSSFFTWNLDPKYRKILKEVKDECEDHSISSDEEASGIINALSCIFSSPNLTVQTPRARVQIYQ